MYYNMNIKPNRLAKRAYEALKAVCLGEDAWIRIRGEKKTFYSEDNIRDENPNRKSLANCFGG
jgi:hypothetical protein